VNCQTRSSFAQCSSEYVTLWNRQHSYQLS